ncbi:hypothetical protein BS50DRAFT_187606 [Corynespora cassiicola Philippines]|uniref:Uncharacterized protein n=1 Tax=Corynespora cassiicola Philippines TaxID=1448308 RepID=A0A2T2P7A5_CORCC|nr:hypothetical protein BS50DRAFT_187606 [Corynespora cassiicola Philippines]
MPMRHEVLVRFTVVWWCHVFDALFTRYTTRWATLMHPFSTMLAWPKACSIIAYMQFTYSAKGSLLAMRRKRHYKLNSGIRTYCNLTDCS